LTAGTRRNGISKLGPFQRADSPRYGEPGRQAVDGPVVVESGGYGEPRYRDYNYGEHGYAPYDDTSAHGDAIPFGYGEPTVQVVQADDEDDAGEASDAGNAGREMEPSRNAGRYTGRHASRRGKTTRKRRVGKVVPVAAVAAAVAAGTAAYALSGGQSQPGHLNAVARLPDVAVSASGSGAGNANGTAVAPIKVAAGTASGGASAPKHAKTAPRRTPAAPPSAAASSPAPAASAHAAATRAAAPAASSSATGHGAAAATLSCNVSAGLLPQNVTAIVSFLLANGYTDNAAAGIAGNIYQESKGNPESVGDGGGGLIGWTPLPSGFVTGNVTADLKTQLSALLTYNQGWASYLPALNAAASPADAASIYVTDFERAGIPAAATREAAAADVARACGI
jgi:Phage tail lysozyme